MMFYHGMIGGAAIAEDSIASSFSIIDTDQSIIGNAAVGEAGSFVSQVAGNVLGVSGIGQVETGVDEIAIVMTGAAGQGEIGELTTSSGTIRLAPRVQLFWM
jgi:hypothetical protein